MSSLVSESLSEGRFQLLEVIGEGGMATVYRAFDQRLRRSLAIKVLAPALAGRASLRARFLGEARAMARLTDPRIVRVVDMGEEGDRAYIIMELVDGGSLLDRVRDHGPLPARMAARVALDLCETLQYAHDEKVIHRDIKPHNILLSRDGSIRVTDFGIAQVQGDEGHQMTRTGAVMGTWGFMAPEQKSDARKVDHRADIYSVGATLWSLLRGETPPELFMADSEPEMLEGLGEELGAVVRRATRYRREDRYPSMREMANSIRSLLPLIPDDPPDALPLVLPRGDGAGLASSTLAQLRSGVGTLGSVPPARDDSLPSTPPSSTLVAPELVPEPPGDLRRAPSSPPKDPPPARSPAAARPAAPTPAPPAAGGAPPQIRLRPEDVPRPDVLPEPSLGIPARGGPVRTSPAGSAGPSGGVGPTGAVAPARGGPSPGAHGPSVGPSPSAGAALPPLAPAAPAPEAPNPFVKWGVVLLLGGLFAAVIAALFVWLTEEAPVVEATLPTVPVTNEPQPSPEALEAKAPAPAAPSPDVATPEGAASTAARPAPEPARQGSDAAQEATAARSGAPAAAPALAPAATPTTPPVDPARPTGVTASPTAATSTPPSTEPATSALPEPFLDVSRPGAAAPGSEVTFRARARSDAHLTLYYRPAGEAAFDAKAFQREGDAFVATVRIDAAASGGLEYFVKATHDGTSVESHEGSAYSPRSVPVAQ